jgi:large subunit ribosomal protein L6
MLAAKPFVKFFKDKKMSRIAKHPMIVPQGVTVDVVGQDIKVSGKLGNLAMRAHDDVAVEVREEEGQKLISFKPRSNSITAKKLYPTTKRLTESMVKGVQQGYKKILELHGVGYRAQAQGTGIKIALGFSHDVIYNPPAGIKLEVENQTKITVSGIDKQKVGQVAAEIRKYRPPEPYKGKGVRYEGEYIARKEGKKK